MDGGDLVCPVARVCGEADVRAYCCPVMGEAVTHHAERQYDSRVSLPGLSVAHLFNTQTFKPSRSPIVYVMPGKGRGKARTETKNIILPFCPFCGAKLDPDFKDEPEATE